VGENYLRISDVVTFRLLDQSLIQVQDDYEGAFKPEANQGPSHPSGLGTTDGQVPQGQGLQIRIAATHAGIITRNNGLYLPDRMKKGATSFTDDYPKPCLLHHEEQKDPVGRIIASDYLDTSGSIQDQYGLKNGLVVRDKMGREKGVITDTMLRDFVEGKMPFGMQVDTICTLFRDSFLEDSAFEGLGHIQIVANITDKSAIEKLLDGRYLTGSVGATTNRAVCSVCRQDWTEDGKCEHRPGGIYDGAKCFIIAGDLLYDEYSFVNVPADRHSKVLQLHFNGIQDSVEIAKQGRIYEVQLSFPQFDSVGKEDTMSKDKEGTPVAEESTVDIKDSASPTPESAEQKTEEQEATDVQDSQTDQSDESAEQVADATDKEGEEQVEDASEEVGLLDRLLDEETDPLSEEEEDKLYDELWAEAEAGFEDGEFTLDELGVENLEDAKLSSEKRKKLAKSTFCGPDRSFPVPDCAHVTAARRLIGRYKGEGSKEKILACVSRKAKALGCDTKGKKKKDNAEQAPEAKADAFEHGRVMHMVIAALEEAQHYSKDPVLEDTEVKSLQMILKRLAAMVGKDAFAKAAVEEGLALDPQCEQTLVDEIVKGEETIGQLRDELGALRSEYTSLYKDLEAIQDSVADQKVAARKAKEGHVTILRTLRDTKVDEEGDFTKLSDTDLDSELTRLADEVDMAKIVGKLGDGMSREPAEEVENPTAIQDENQKSATPAELEAIQAQHLYLKFTQGSGVADAFVKRMQQEGKLPQDSEN